MGDGGSDIWAFETDRLGVGPWHEVADRLGIDLTGAVSELLTVQTTEALPAPWPGEYSRQSARGWINDRDADSTMLLVVGSDSKPVGVLILAEIPIAESGTDLRLGYLLAQHTWGHGYATELVSGLIDWARTQPRINTLTGGIDPENRASVRVLEKCGFGLIDDADPGAAMYQYEIVPSNEWDCYAPGWDADSAARAYASAAFTSLLRLLRDADIPLDDARVIDFGCGTGLLTERLVAAGATVDAVDTSTAMLAGVGTKIALHGWTGVRTSTSLPDEHELFDLVVCSSVCSFLVDYPAMAHELVMRLRAGGLFVQWDWERSSQDSHGLTRSEIREALTNAGLIDVTVDDAFSVTADNQTMAPIVGHGQRPLSIAQP